MERLEDEMGAVVEALAAGARIVERRGEWHLGARALPREAMEALRESGLVALEGREALLLPAGRRSRDAARGGRRPRVERPVAADAAGRRPAARTLTVAVGEAPLGWLRARGLLSARQFAAGEQLHADWTRAQLAPSVTMRWDAAPAASGPHGPAAPLAPSERQVAARRRFDAAMAAAGPGLADVLWRVACAGEGLDAAERALGWPGRSAKVVLVIALDRIADHYRLPPATPLSTSA